MRYLLVATFVAGLSAAALTARADNVCRTGTPQRYSHEIAPEHRQKCQQCHRPDVQGNVARPAGKPNPHRPCSTPACHAREFKAAQRCPKQLLSVTLLCGSCHGLGARRRRGSRVPVVYPPYQPRGGSDFYLATYDHAAHAALDGADCARCHGDRNRGQSRALGHPTCGTSACHGGKQTPRMTDCEGCHQRAKGRAVVPRWSTQSYTFRVKAAFDHQQHAAAAGDSECQTCHTTHAETGAPQPLPKKPACTVCHDHGGGKAFAAAGAGCPRCHVQSKP